MADHKHTPKERTKLRRLRKKGHSPAGARYLIEQQKKTTPVYFKHIRRVSTMERLRQAGLSESDLRSLGAGRKKIRRKR